MTHTVQTRSRGVRRGLAVALALGLAASGCAAAGGGADVDPDGTWVLVSGRTAEGPLAVPPRTLVTLTFDGDGMSGKAPCNNYGACSTCSPPCDVARYAALELG